MSGSGALLALLLAGPGDVSTLTGPEMTALVRDIKPRVEELRGLRFKREVPVKVVAKAAATEHFRKRAEKFWPKDRARLEQRLLRQLGLLPADYDLVDGIFELLEEQVAGYYDPDTDTFFVVSSMPRASAPIIIAHELTHALDDQHYDIDRMLERTMDDDDAQAAVSALVEGSGTLVMSAYMIREMGAGRLAPEALLEMQKAEAGRAAQLQATPAYVQRSLLAPYVVGQAFLLRGNLAGMVGFATKGSPDLDRAFQGPPTSFEQVLHPGKYWDPARRDTPSAVRLKDQSASLGPGFSLSLSGTLGEMGLAVMAGLGGVDPGSAEAADMDNWTNEAAAGWDGDRYQLYTSGPQAVSVLLSRWDTEADAVQFEKAVAGRGRHLARRGSSVAVVAGDRTELHATLAASALATP
jgi:hypothetical protein